METMSILLMLAAAVLSLVILFKILAAPIRLVFKLLLNALCGFALLIVVNIISGFFDFSVEINFYKRACRRLLWEFPAPCFWYC